MNQPGDLDLKTNPWRKCARMLAGLVVAIAILVLAGWLTGRLGLASWGDADFVPMAPSTALMTLLFSLGLMAGSQEAASRLNRAVTIVAAIIIFGLSGLLLIQWVFDFDCGLEAIIAHSHLALWKFGGQPAGHMSPVTAVGLLIPSLALFILQLATGRRALLTWAAILALTTVAIGFVVSLGYAYGAPLFYDGSLIPIALPTGLSILLLGAGVLVAAGPSAWPMRRLVGPAVSARLMRVFLPSVLFIVLIDSWLRRLIIMEFGASPVVWTSVLILVSIVIAILIITVLSRTIGGAIDQKEEELRASEQKFAATFRNNPQLMAISSLVNNQLLDVNETWLRTLGFQRDEVVGRTSQELGLFVDSNWRSQALQILLRDGKFQGIEAKVRTKDGQIRHGLIGADIIQVQGQPLLLTVMTDITERRQAEERAERFSRIFENSINEVYIFDAETFHFLQVNQSALRNLDYTMEEMGRLTALDVNPLFSPESFKAMAAPLLSGTMNKIIFQARQRRKNGSMYPVEVHLQLSTQSERRFFVAIVLDITERQQAERELQESERKYRELVENANSIILRLSSDGRVTFMNEFGQKFFGYSAAEIIGQPAIGTIVPENETTGRDLRPLIEAVCTDTQSFEHNINENMRRGGERVWIVWTNKVVKNAAGGIEEVMSIGTDITERRQAEETLRLREEQFRRILDNMQDAYFQVDREGRLVNVSPSAVRLYGYGSVEEMIGMPAACLYKDAAMRDKVIEELRRNGRVHDLTGEGRKKDGSCFWVSLNAQIHYGANGQIMGSEGFVRDTSERRRAEEALRASENRYRYFVEQTMEGFYRLEADGPIPIDRPVDEVVQSMYRHLYIAECNEAFARMYGYAGVQQIVGRRFVDLHGGTDIPENLEALGAFVRANCQMLNAETREMDKNGNEVVFSNNSVGIIENGLLVSTWGTQLDITAQKRAEEALQESEQRFRMVLDGSRLGFWDWDIQSNKVQRNERWAEMLGYTLEEVWLTVKQWSDLIHPDDRAAARASISDHLQGKTPMHRAEYRMRAKDGHYKWILDQARIMMRDAQGKPLRMCGTHTDITERKQVEDALQKQLVALSQPLDNPANIQFTDLFSLKDLQRIQDEFAEATGVASIITYPDGTPITKPSKFCRLCNDIIRQTDIGRANCFKSDAAIGRHSFDGPICQPCLSGGLWDAGASISIGGRHVANWLIGQVRNEELDESQILHYAEVIGADRDEFRRALAEVPVMSKAQFDKVARILFTLANELSMKAYQNIQQARFITEHKQTEVELVQHREHLEEQVQRRTAELAEARDQAQAANRAKSAFLANMSHELRTPLNAVLGFAQIMSSDRTISAQAKENLSIILRSGEHLLALINDILDLSKIEAGRSNLDLHDVDLDLLIQDVADMMRFKAETKGLRLVIEQSAEFPRFAIIDPGKFRQILVNLVGNGVKFTKAGQVAVRLDARPAPDGYLLNIEVRDTGIGIAKSDFELVFRPFEQIGAKTIEGTGLGLAITRQYVQMLGGEISIDSELGKGSCFHFTLPVGRVGTDSAQALAGHRAPVGIGSPTAEIRLLIVEDQPENRLLIRCFLEPFGFQLREATNGQEAVAAFEEWRPHLIFMDRRMPVMDGMEAIRRIRMSPEGRGTVIVAVSAHSFKEEQQEMLDAGCDDFLGKPFGLTDLLALLKKHLHLDLVYGDVAAASPAGRRPLTSADLQSVPVAELRNLRRWALEAQADDLMAWANGPNDLSPEARQVLACLLQEYRFDMLTQAIDPLLPVQKPGESPAEA